MNDLDSELQRFVTAYRTRSIPAPHILLVGPDDARNAMIAQDFATRLGVQIRQLEGGKIEVQGELSMTIVGSGLAYISNIQRLKKIFIEKLVRDLPRGEFEIVIGKGPAARTHHMDIASTTLVATCPTKYDCPPQLLKIFETVLLVQPPTPEELMALLEQEAWKDRIGLDHDAAALVVRASGGRTDTMLHQFRRLCGVIEQVKTTNKPQLTTQEVADALERLRIKVSPPANSDRAFDIHTLSGQEFEHVIISHLTEMGFEAELTKATGDGGIDIVAKLDKPFVGGRYLFQCKRYIDGNMVGASEVRDFYGAVMADRALKGILITTSDFTSQAREFAIQSGIELINLPKLMQLFEDNRLKQYL